MSEWKLVASNTMAPAGPGTLAYVCRTCGLHVAEGQLPLNLWHRCPGEWTTGLWLVTVDGRFPGFEALEDVADPDRIYVLVAGATRLEFEVVAESEEAAKALVGRLLSRTIFRPPAGYDDSTPAGSRASRQRAARGAGAVSA